MSARNNFLDFVTSDTVNRLLDYPSLFNGIEKGLANFSNRKAGGIDQPVRSTVAVSEANGFLGCMPVYSKEDDVLATKLVSFYPLNKNCPTHSAIIAVFYPQTGIPRAILDGDVITAKRTAATSLVASKYLVNGEPEILAILGSGVQAKSHYEAFSHMYNFTQVRIWNHRKEGAQKLADELGSKCVAVNHVAEAVENADVIVTATSATEPVLKLEWVKPGVHINAVGACRPNWSEIDPLLMNAATVYVDSQEGALKESGDIIISQSPIFAEIGEVINGTKEAKRKEITVFKSLGMAIEDAIAAKIVLDKMESLPS